MTDREILWDFMSLCLQTGTSVRLRNLNGCISQENTALIGESGAGKSSLLKVLAGYERPSSGRLQQHLTDDSGRLPLFWVPQDGGLWPGIKVIDHLNWVSELPVDSADPIVQSFGMAECLEKIPEQLSQGQRERLSLLRGLMSKPRVLLIDEPLSRVGQVQRVRLWQQTVEYAQEHGMTLVFATHETHLIRQTAINVLVLQQGELVYQGQVEELYHNPPSESLAWQLGPVNWKSSEQWKHWFDDSARDTGNSIRPEKLSVEHDHQAISRLVSVKKEGQLQRVVLRHETGMQEEFLTLPSRPELKPGMPARLCLWLCLMLGIVLSGCFDGTSPKMPVSKIHTFSLPASGPHVPSPRAVHVTPEGTLLVLDTIGQILEMTKAGDLITSWPMPESDVGRPEGLAVLSDGRIAVADTHYHQVVFFDRQGNFLNTLGRYGTGPAEFVYPVALCEDDTKHLYVCEYDNERVQKFTSEGEFVLSFGSPGTQPGQFLRPSGIAWFEGQLYVADAFNNRLQVFNELGELIDTLPRQSTDTPDQQGFEFLYPYDIALSRPGELCVVEYGAGRVSRWDLKSGSLIGTFGSTGTENGQFSTPWGIGADRQGRIYIADTGNRRVVELSP